MLVLPADVTDAASVAATAARVREELGPIDLAVLSAGYWKQMDTSDWDTELFDQHLRVNLTGMSNATGGGGRGGGGGRRGGGGAREREESCLPRGGGEERWARAPLLRRQVSGRRGGVPQGGRDLGRPAGGVGA